MSVTTSVASQQQGRHFNHVSHSPAQTVRARRDLSQTVRKGKGRHAKLTSRLLPQPLADNTLLLQVNVPAGRLAGLVLEGEGEDGLALLDGVLALGVGLEGVGDGVEGGGGGEFLWTRLLALWK